MGFFSSYMCDIFSPLYHMIYQMMRVKYFFALSLKYYKSVNHFATGTPHDEIVWLIGAEFAHLKRDIIKACAA